MTTTKTTKTPAPWPTLEALRNERRALKAHGFGDTPGIDAAIAQLERLDRADAGAVAGFLIGGVLGALLGGAAVATTTPPSSSTTPPPPPPMRAPPPPSSPAAPPTFCVNHGARRRWCSWPVDGNVCSDCGRPCL